ncbi:MAG: hypothetical protein PHW24_04875, partial [Candidatus Moranbacteria bacterium]|nr:hypothetical protein [Candidatus Moranbacteria bacterium]
MQRLLADAKMGKVMFLALAFLLLFGIGNAKAQQSEIQKIDNTFQISPLRYDWVVDLNDERQGVVFVKNNATVPINIETEIQDFSVNQDLQNNTRFFVPNENHPLKAYDVINWINIDKEPFRLEPGEAKAVNFSAKIPMTTPTGGYYGVIFFTKKPIEEEISNAPVQLNVTTRLGILLTFGVKGKEPINEKGNLALFSPTKKVFIDNPVGFNTQLANTGN